MQLYAKYIRPVNVIAFFQTTPAFIFASEEVWTQVAWNIFGRIIYLKTLLHILC